MKRTILSVLLAFGLTIVLTPVQLSAADAGSKRLIEAAVKAGELDSARKGEIRYWSNTPAEKELFEIGKAFNARFGLNVEVKGLPISSMDVVNRLIISAQAGRAADGDVMVHSPSSLYYLHQRNLLESFGWVELLGQEFPDIRRRVDRLAPEFRNAALELYHLVYIIAYRTDRVKKEEAPRTWADLANPKWSGRVAVPNSASPFSFLAAFPAWGEKKAFELAKGVKDNRALTVKGSPAVAATLESGEATLGVTTVGNVEYSKAKGVPIDWTIVPGVVVNPKNLAVAKGAPHSNLARLFIAWLSTQGRPQFEQLTHDGLAWPEEDSSLAKKIKQAGVGGDLLVMDSYEKEEIGQKNAQKLMKIYMSQ
jgi:iron(III) transport system substrate-binding protein